MDNLKTFDPADIDESLVRVVSHGDKHYVLFPYVDATGTAPEFKSVGLRIAAVSLTQEDLSKVATLARERADKAAWCMHFNTPWLLRGTEADEIFRRKAPGRVKRD